MWNSQGCGNVAGSSIHVKKWEGESGESELPGKGDFNSEDIVETHTGHFGGITGCFCITIFPLKTSKT